MNRLQLSISENDQHLQNILKALANEKRLKVFIYLQEAGVATNSIISRNIKLNKSVTSKCLKHLLNANLIVREKIFSSVVYTINKSLCSDYCQ
jgi:predicted transcriptional regulator